MGSDPSERLKAALQYIFDDSNLDDMKELVREGSGINTLTLKRTLLPRCSFDIFPMKDITTLHFSKNRLGPQAFNFLMLALAKAPAALTHVDASSNMATHECCASIADAISSTKTIRWLNLSDNPLTTSAAESVGGSLKANRSLRHLGLAAVGIVDASLLFGGLAGHPLESLDVSGNACGPRSFTRLGQALTAGLALRTLLARGADMRNEGAAALAGGLRASKCVPPSPHPSPSAVALCANTTGQQRPQWSCFQRRIRPFARALRCAAFRPSGCSR